MVELHLDGYGFLANNLKMSVYIVVVPHSIVLLLVEDGQAEKYC